MWPCIGPKAVENQDGCAGRAGWGTINAPGPGIRLDCVVLAHGCQLQKQVSRGAVREEMPASVASRVVPLEPAITS